MELLIKKLSEGLNRPIQENFVLSLKKYISENPGYDKFLTYCKILGFPNEEFIVEIYNLIASDTKQDFPLKPKKKVLINFDDDEIDLESTKPKPKSKLKFKKLKKDDTLRFKEDMLKRPQNEPVQIKSDEAKSEPPKQTTKPSLAALASQEIAQRQEEDVDIDVDIGADLDIENDRDWYMQDELVNSSFIDDDDITPRKAPIRSKPRHRSNGVGGRFDENGKYIDLDHDDESSKLDDIPISSHFFVPPFLDSLVEFLAVQLNKGQDIKGITSTFNPVKNPNSHLAIMAKQGSFVVNERRSKKERAKQAQERSSLSGTQLGKVIGVKESDEEAHQAKEAIEEEHDSITQLDIQRKSLPVYSVRSKLVQVVQENQITIIVGETGSGKTTQLPQYLYEEGFGNSIAKHGIRKMIACTQPRRVAAMSVAKRVSEEMNCKLGEEVGYSIRFEDVTSADKTVIKYMTDGILLRELLVDSNLSDYSCVIMDEAHERSLNTDVLLGLLRLLVTRRKDLKLIITSATMNAERFTEFFGNAPQFYIPGRTFPVDIFYNRSANDYVDAAVKQVLTIHLENLNSDKESDGDILVFMTGQEDIEVTCEMIQEKLDELDGVPPLDVYPIYSTLPADMQKKIFNKSNKLRRKVVVATNIAETSLTVDGVKYVIDSGLVKLKVYNAKLGMDALQIMPISQANANQRSGRAGRTGPGKAYRLFSEKEMGEDLNLMPIPEIQRTNLNNVMLLLKSLKVKDISTFPFMDLPPQDIMACSLYDLWSIGALDNLGNLTSLGSQMIQFPMDPSLSKFIILACQEQFNCSYEAIVIVSMLSVPNIFHRPKERAQEADLMREKFAVSESDHLTLLNVYLQWESQAKKGRSGSLISWCNKNFLNIKSLLRAKDIKNQLILIMKKLHLKIAKANDDNTVKRCLCASFFTQLAKLSKLNLTNSNQIEYASLRHGFMRMYLHPTSALNNSANIPPTFVIYHELMFTSKEYINCVTAVDPLWLLEYGYIFYGVSKQDRKKYLEFDLGFNIVDKETFSDTLEKDRQKYLQDSNSTKQKKIETKKAIKTDKFKRRRGI